MHKRQLISTRISSTNIEPEEKRKLELLVAAKAFAKAELDLPAKNSYRHYSDLKRPFVTWNVVATESLSMQPIESCFPIVGCLSYRGYFTKSAAEQHAEKLNKQGLETYIAGASAYSTLGWFDDPVVSPMLRYSDYALLETLFHELAHQKIYFPSDSHFNETFATAIGQYGVRKWLQVNASKSQQHHYETYLNRRHAFIELLQNTADELRQIYKQKNKTTQQLNVEKNTAYTQLKQRYKAFTKHYAYKGYDKWFSQPVNNPRLSSISTYHQLTPHFILHLEKCENDIKRFYRSIAKFRLLTPIERRQNLINSQTCLG